MRAMEAVCIRGNIVSYKADLKREESETVEFGM